jgi:hypothetical protein
MAKSKWKKGNRADVVAALSKSLKHLPKLTAKNFNDALGDEFEFKMGPLGVPGSHCQQIWKPDGGIPSHGCPLVWKPMGVGGGNCHLVMKPMGGIGPPHCAPTAMGAQQRTMELHLRSLVKKKAKKPVKIPPSRGSLPPKGI